MTWHGEPQRHMLASKGIKTRKTMSTLISGKFFVFEERRREKSVDGIFDNTYRVVTNLSDIDPKVRFGIKFKLQSKVKEKGCVQLGDSFYCRSLSTALEILKETGISKTRSEIYRNFIPFDENRTIYVKIDRDTGNPNSGDIWVTLRETERRSVV